MWVCSYQLFFDGSCRVIIKNRAVKGHVITVVCAHYTKPINQSDFCFII